MAPIDEMSGVSRPKRRSADMGRLFYGLISAPGIPDAGDSCESANPSSSSRTKIAESQYSQPVAAANLGEVRKFAGFARAPVLAQSEERLMHLCLAIGIDWQAVSERLIDGDSEAGIDQLDHDKGDGRELAAVVEWLRLLAREATAQSEGT